jgi:Protein of unknown function (DUF5672)
MEQAEFADVLLLSDQDRPADMDPSITWRRIGKLASRADYSQFMLRELADHIETSHALCVQWDGYVLDGHAWRRQFLDYDYIGAVWPQFDDDYRVGNGGFSLRSRRLLEATKSLPLDNSEAEDIQISRTHRSELEKRGLQFAPESVAEHFAYERTLPTGREFGFHGAFNLVRYLPPKRTIELFRSLEPGMLARNERTDLFWWALARGRLNLALAMFWRIIT